MNTRSGRVTKEAIDMDPPAQQQAQALQQQQQEQQQRQQLQLQLQQQLQQKQQQQQQQQQKQQQQQQGPRAPSWRVAYLLQSANGSRGWRRHNSPHEVLIQPDATSDNNHDVNRRHYLVIRDAFNASRVQERVPLGNGVESILQAAYVAAAEGDSIIRFSLRERGVKKFAVITDSGRSAAEICQALDRQGVRVQGMDDLPDAVFLRGDDQRSSEALEANIPNLSRPEVQAYIVRLLFQDSFHDFVRDLSEMFCHVQSHIPSPPVVAGPSEPAPATGILVQPPADTTATTQPDIPGNTRDAASSPISPRDGCDQSIDSDETGECAQEIHRDAMHSGGSARDYTRGGRVARGDAGEDGESISNERDATPRNGTAGRRGNRGRGNAAGRGGRSGGRGDSEGRKRVMSAGGQVGRSVRGRGRGDSSARYSVRGGRGSGRLRGNRDGQGSRGGATGRGVIGAPNKRIIKSEFSDRSVASKRPRTKEGDKSRVSSGSMSTAAGALRTSSGKQQQRPLGVARRSTPSEPAQMSTMVETAKRTQARQRAGSGRQPSSAVLGPDLQGGGVRNLPATNRDSVLARQQGPKLPVGKQKLVLEKKRAAGPTSRHGTVGVKNAIESKSSGTKTQHNTKGRSHPKGDDGKNGAGTRDAGGSSKEIGNVAGKGKRVVMATPVVLPTTTGRSVGLSTALNHMWAEVNKHRSAWPFCKAVDLAEAPDYLEIVKRPVDLPGIRTRLDGAVMHYTSTDMLYDDLVLMCRNGLLYFDKGTDFHSAAGELLQFIESRFARST